ncbi:MAG TPA: hypothetical protein VGM88_34535 [Kofleriaceae bacterium]
MRFGPWYPLGSAPPGPGLLQVRIASGLLDYPRGKSAMVWYEHSTDVATSAAQVASAHRGVTLWGRHLIEVPPGTDLGAFCEKLRLEFVRRFGSPPAYENP